MAIPKSNDPLAVHQEPPYLVLLFPEQADRDLQQRHQLLAHVLQVVSSPPLRQFGIVCSDGINQGAVVAVFLLQNAWRGVTLVEHGLVQHPVRELVRRHLVQLDQQRIATGLGDASMKLLVQQPVPGHFVERHQLFHPAQQRIECLQ